MGWREAKERTEEVAEEGQESGVERGAGGRGWREAC